MQTAIAVHATRGLSRMPAAGWCLAIWAEGIGRKRNELERALEQVEHAIELTERD